MTPMGNVLAFILVVLSGVILFILVDVKERREREKARKKEREKKEREEKKWIEINRLQSAMEKASKEKLNIAEKTLFDVGIWVENFGAEVKIKLPEFFWDVPCLDMIAKTLITLVRSSDVYNRGKLYISLLNHMLNLDKELCMSVLTRLLASDIGGSFSIYTIAYAISRL